MGLFSGWYTKEGPGVPKNAPKKKGIARFFEIFGRDAGMLWRAGMLTTLCFVPCLIAAVFTALSFPYLGMMLIGAVIYVLSSMLVGPSLCALHAVVVTAVRDEPCYMMHVYKKAWKDNARQSRPLGMVMMILYAAHLYTGYLMLTNKEGPQYLMLGLTLLCLLLVTSCSLMTFLQMLFLDMPVLPMVKNSLLMTFGYTTRVLPATLTILVCGALVLGFVPWPLWPIVGLLGIVGYVTLIADMWAWPSMEKAFHITEQQDERRIAREAEEAGLLIPATPVAGASGEQLPAAGKATAEKTAVEAVDAQAALADHATADQAENADAAEDTAAK